VTIVLWIVKVLDFGHLELSDSQQTLLRMNLISKSKSNLSSSYWHFPIIILQ
jgi:hypothetical protein